MAAAPGKLPDQNVHRRHKEEMNIFYTVEIRPICLPLLALHFRGTRS